MSEQPKLPIPSPLELRAMLEEMVVKDCVVLPHPMRKSTNRLCVFIIR